MAPRYPGFDVLAKWSSADFDDPTREVVRRRVEEVPPLRFFTAEEAATLQAVADRIVPQEDRAAGERIPIVPWIDQKLARDERDGFRDERLPPQRETWRQALAGLDQAAEALHAAPFAKLGPSERDALVDRLAGGEMPGEIWATLPAKLFFRQLLQLVVRTYYAHPTAWSEVGYNGPSAIRGHVRVWAGGVDPWEAHEAEAHEAEAHEAGKPRHG